MAPPPPPPPRHGKGKAGNASSSSGPSASRKEQRIAQVRQARTIATQPSASSSSSTPAATLPSQLEIDPYLTSRSFEISALQSAMRTARTSSSTRAWQLLPRHARRRAASHNVLRLPSRLRAKGLAELRSSTTLAKTRSAIRKRLPNHPLSISQARKTELRGRAARPEGKWLETHLWMSKRFRMSREEFDGDRWGYVLPEEPSMKGEKTDWRAAKRGCAVWDASWEGWVRVGVKAAKVGSGRGKGKGKGREMDVDGDGSEDDASLQQAKAVELLEQVVQAARLVPSGSVSGEALCFSASSSSHAVVAYDVILHGGNEGANSDRALCPATLYLVRPSPCAGSQQTRQPAKASSSSSSGAGPSSPKPTQQHRRLRPLLSLLPPPPQQSDVHPDAELLIRAHPAAIDVLQRAIEAAVSKAQKAQKKVDGEGERRAHLVVKRLETAPADVLVGDESKQRRGAASTSSSGSEIKDEKVVPPPPLADATAVDDAPSSSSSHRHSPAPRSTHLTQQLSHRLSLLRRAELRNRAFCVFELYGPKSWEVLGKAVQPVRRGLTKGEERGMLQRWDELTAKGQGKGKGKGKERDEEGGSVSAGTPCLSLRVHDPRLGLRRGPTVGAAAAASSKRPTGSKEAKSGQKPTAPPGDQSSASAEATSQGKRKFADLGEGQDAAAPPSKMARTSGDQDTASASFPGQCSHPNLFTDGYDYPRHTKGDLDARRAALLASGTSQATSGSRARSGGSSSGKGRRRGGGNGHNSQPAHLSSFLAPTSSDDVIPIIVVPRPTTSPSSPGGLTLLIPQGWARPFFYSLLGSSAIPGTGSGEARAIGFAGMRNLAREGGEAWFPDEWPHSHALKEKKGEREGEGGLTAWERSVTFAMGKKMEEWMKRPKGKRVNFEKLRVEWPFGGVGMWVGCAGRGEEVLRGMLKAVDGAEEVGKEGKAIPKKSVTAAGLHLHGSPLLLRAQIAWLRRLLDTTSSTPSGGAHKDPLLARAHSLLLRSCGPTSATSYPLVLLSIETLPGSGGSLEEGDELHLPDSAAGMGAAGPIGALTTGRFSLTRGRSTGMALCSASAWVVAVAAAQRDKGPGRNDETAAGEEHEGGHGAAEKEGEITEQEKRAKEKGTKKKTTSLVKLAGEAFGADWQSASSEEEWETARLVVRSIAGGLRREVVAKLVRV